MTFSRLCCSTRAGVKRNQQFPLPSSCLQQKLLGLYKSDSNVVGCSGAGVLPCRSWARRSMRYWFWQRQQPPLWAVTQAVSLPGRYVMSGTRRRRLGSSQWPPYCRRLVKHTAAQSHYEETLLNNEDGLCQLCKCHSTKWPRTPSCMITAGTHIPATSEPV